MSNSSQTSSSQQNSLNPWSQQQYTNAAGNVNNILSGGNMGSYTPYSGQLVSPQTAMQNQAGSMAQSGLGTGQTQLNQASTGATAAQGYSPQTVTPQSLANTNLSPYMNPYTQDVTNATMNQLNLQNQQQLNNEANQFTSNGAFGGARQGVADAQTNNLFANTAASTLAGLNQSNYTNAQSAAQGDIANNLQGQLANQSAGLQGAGLNLSASGLLGSLGSQAQQMGLNNVNELYGLGSGQQNTQTAQDQSAYQNYMLGQMTPSQQAQMELGLLGETPMLQNSQGTSSTTSFNPMSDISGIGGLFAGGSGSAMSGLLALSDERTKENVITIGRDRKGRRWVEFSYHNEPGRHVGVMAQEVQKTDPDAVVEHPMLGLLMVDYSKLAEAA